MKRGKDLVMQKMEERGVTAYQLAKALGVSRQNVSAILRNASDTKFNIVANAMAALGYEFELKEAPYRTVAYPYLDYVAHRGRPAALFVAEHNDGYYAVDNRDGGCYFIAFDQKDTKEENRKMIEEWLEKAT